MTRSIGLAVLLAVLQYAPPIIFNRMLITLSSGSPTARQQALGYVLLIMAGATDARARLADRPVMMLDAVIDLQQRARLVRRFG